MTAEIDLVLERADRAAKALAITRTTMSARLFNDWKKLDRIADGGDVNSRTLDQVKLKLVQIEREAGLSPRAKRAKRAKRENGHARTTREAPRRKRR